MHDNASAADDLREKFAAVRAYTEKLCEPLEIEDYIPQPVVDVSPPRWNIAHTTWFFEEMILKKYLADYEVFDPNFSFLFNSYYNSIGDRTARDNRGALSRPPVREIFAYRKHVNQQIDVVLTSLPGREDAGTIRELVTLGLNHEQQHQELFLTDVKFTFSLNPLNPAYDPGYSGEEKIEESSNEWIRLPEGVYEIGYSGDGFCFDNELARHKVFLHDFAIASRGVTNAEFLEFIDSGAYSDFRLWHSEGWDWVNREAIKSPLYWQNRDGEWHQFMLRGLRPIVPEAPVCHVSFYEASAFAEWSGRRLPTEFEWEAASDRFDWGKRWEWTNSAYLPYPGFAKADGAVGEYNGKFMINQMVLRGASVATPPGHSRPTYRNFFHPHLRWQFTGIRLAGSGE
jgi:ergothioneine biosynthesis protein EgtB